jgi:1-acyl-sn-glycerol-3-phosphate acyltransferase
MEDWKLEPAHDLGLSGLQRSRSLQRESGLVASMARLAVWSSVRTALRLIHKLKVEGTENLPATPSFVMVSNHASHFDALVLGSALRLAWRDHVCPLAAGDVFFESPGIAALATTLINARPVWRRRPGSHEINTLRQQLQAGDCIYILFPEGGRTRDGSLAPFKPGVGMMVAGTQVPVVPCYLHGTFEVFPANRVIPRLLPIEIRIGMPLTFDAVSNTSAGWRRVAGDIETAVRCLKDKSDLN